jgi:hypothetical protein
MRFTLRNGMPRHVIAGIIYSGMELHRYWTQTTLSNYVSSAFNRDTPLRSINHVKLPDIMPPEMKEEVLRDLESRWSS